MVIGLVVPVLNNFKGFTELMESLNEPVLPVVMNNWDENKGVSNAWNNGIRWAQEAGCSHIMVANDDVIFVGIEPLRELQTAMDIAEVDLITPTNIRDGFVPSPRTFEPPLAKNPDFAAFMIRVDFTERFGWFDENFYPAYFEDNDMARRILVEGGRYANHLGVGFLHKGSQTQNSVPGGVVPSPVFEKNRAYYIEKWGGMPMEEKFISPFNEEIVTMEPRG